ncbi:MAG: magnesium transporter [Bdellovibrionales bacterium]|nr:magnesium transporter [Bdellovibrionales bacterium]
MSEQQENNTAVESPDINQLIENWSTTAPGQHIEIFLSLPRHHAEELFLSLSAQDRAEIYLQVPFYDRRSWLRLLAPDDIVDLFQQMTAEQVSEAMTFLDPQTRIDVQALSAYAEDKAGGLMNSRYARLRPDISVEEAIRYLRAQTRADIETIYYAYVLDNKQKLQGVASLRQLFIAHPAKLVADIMVKGDDLITLADNLDQEEISRIFAKTEQVALPVVDAEGHMKGIVTFDDVVKVTEEEATEDMQRVGGMSALESPYFKASFFMMLRKRAGWLLVLFIGELFTATAMAHYEDQIAKTLVLTLFIPLIISSGGNSGSQASTLIIRAMAIGEVRIIDWWRVMMREAGAGLCLGLILGVIGLLRVYLIPLGVHVQADHYFLISITVGLSLIGIVFWGTFVGSMLPFIFRRIGFDPATASAPFVATLVDITGLILYFSVAQAILTGTLL